MDISLLLAIINTVVSIAMVCIAVFGIRIGGRILFKNEKVYGQEAKERYAAIKHKLPDNLMYNNAPYGGGAICVPCFEVERFRYDAQTMLPEWKGITKTVRYCYDENGTTMVKSWRLK